MTIVSHVSVCYQNRNPGWISIKRCANEGAVYMDSAIHFGAHVYSFFSPSGTCKRQQGFPLATRLLPIVLFVAFNGSKVAVDWADKRYRYAKYEVEKLIHC
jgi:hypothetical protein